MADKNKNKDPFKERQVNMAKRVIEYKLGDEANVVSMMYKNPDLLRETNIGLDDIHNNCWKVYFEILKGLIIDELKVSVSDIDVGLYLNKHPKLAKKYEEYGGYDTVEKSGTYVNEQNFEGYVSSLRKWNTVLKLIQRGFPCDEERLSDICDMSAEEVYDEYTIHLNDIFSNVDKRIHAENGFDGMFDLIDELEKGKNVGIPFANCEILSAETGGMIGGNIIGMGAASGVGKSTLSINYIFPSVQKLNLKAVFIINEEDASKFRKEALCWYCSNIAKKPVPKHVLRDGKFDDETKAVLYEAAKWFEDQKENNNITIIPLEQYTSKTVVKLLKKYTKMQCDIIVLDTLKESHDSRDTDTWKSMMNDCVDFYDCIKHTDTCMVITYQLVKNRSKYLTSADIGVSKGIIDVFSVNMFFRRPLQTEYEGEKDALYCYRITEKGSKVPFPLEKDKHYMLCFLSKNRFGQSDVQIVSNADFSINKYEDKGYAKVMQDY